MAWFDDLKTPRINPRINSKDPNSTSRTSKVPEGLWVKCSQCGDILQSKVLRENLQVCPDCQFHMRMTAAERIRMLSDDSVFEEYGEDLVSTDPLEFDDRKSYRDR